MSRDRRAPRVRHHHWLVLGSLIGAAGLFRVTQNMAITSFSLLGKRELGLSAGTLGALAAISGVTLVLVMVTAAARVPAQQAAAAVVAASLLLAASLLTFATATSLVMLVLAVVLLGAAGGLGLPVLLNAVENAAGENRQRAAALYSVALSASLALGPLIETAVLDGTAQKLRAPFIVFVAFPLIAAVLVLGQAIRAHRRRSDPIVPPPATEIKASDPYAATQNPSPFGSEGRGAGTAARRSWHQGLVGSRDGRLALTAQLLYAVPFAGITVFAALVGEIVFRASPAETQLGFTAFFMTSLAVRVVVSWRSPVLHKMALFLLSALLTTAGILLLGTGHGLGFFFLAMALLGFPHGMTFPLSLALVADSMSDVERPRANANLLAASNLATIVVPASLGALVPYIGYRGMTLSILAPLAFFTALLWIQRPGKGLPAMQARPGVAEARGDPDEAPRDER